jgi:hypothetical protein
MSPFEALYGRKCRTPLNWTKTGESQVFGPDIDKDHAGDPMSFVPIFHSESNQIEIFQ